MTQFILKPNAGTKFVGTITINNERGGVQYNVATEEGQGVLVEETEDGFHVDVLP